MSFRAFFESVVTKKANIITPSLRNKVNAELSAKNLGSYFASLPLNKIEQILKKHGLVLLDDDGTEWQGMIHAGSGYQKVLIDYAFADTAKNGVYLPMNNSVLVLGYEKMENGKYDVNVYLS